jgi:hypothetical protein
MRHTSLLTLAVLGCGLLWPADPLFAQTPITSATVRRVVNQVGILRGGSSWKPAQVNDPLSRGDALRTRIKSRSDVQLNDGSLARLGELSVWNFIPGTRDQVLQSGTGLFLIRPGQGPSRIKTPYGSAGIRGSALFVRVNEETQTTIVGALTNNPQGPMEITTPDGKQIFSINAGQMAIVQNNQVAVVDFDLRTFYKTSSMVEGLDLQGTSGVLNQDPAIAAVQAETIAAVETQLPLSAQDVASSPVLLSAPQPGHVNLGQQESEKTLTLQEFNRQQNGGVIVSPPVVVSAPAAAVSAPAAQSQQPLVPAAPQTITTPSPVSGNGGGVTVPGVVGEVRPAPVVGPSLPSTTPATPTTPIVTPTLPIGNPDSSLGGGSSPAVTNTPAAPPINSTPAAPVINNTTAAPVINNTPAVSVYTHTPAAPVINNTPAAPVINDTPAAPVINSTPAAPVINNAPAAPIVNNTPAAPVINNTPPAPIVNNTPAAPVINNTPPAPIVNNTPAAPVINNTPAAPIVNNTPAAPVINNTPAVPVTTNSGSNSGPNSGPNSGSNSGPSERPESNDRPDPNLSTSR